MLVDFLASASAISYVPFILTIASNWLKPDLCHPDLVVAWHFFVFGLELIESSDSTLQIFLSRV